MIEPFLILFPSSLALDHLNSGGKFLKPSITIQVDIPKKAGKILLEPF
ncbi:hypothetical protein [Leptospira adleri]|nr:hypothetical protein [Leptospira adleri]